MKSEEENITLTAENALGLSHSGAEDKMKATS